MNDSIGMNYCAPDANVWAVNLDGRYMSAVQNYLVADGIPTDGVTKIISNAAQTLSYCPDPEGIGKCQKTGIVIGKVQSGKTSNFISITALAFDNDYDIVIVLSGTKKPLVKQNRDRIKEYFSTTKDVLVLDTTDFKDQLTAQKMHQFRKMNKKVVIVALKSPAQINYIADNIFFDSVLAEKPILIIDDEGDEASLNTLVKKGKKSSTYKAIENLKERLDRHCFLSITATPQANLLIDTLDVLSPDFGILVDPGKGYCGLDVYHSDTTYTRKIPDSETSLLDDGIPQSFIDAISMFFVACAIYKNRGMKPGDKLSMLIHPSQLKADHEKVFKKVEGLINDWCQKSEDKRDIAYNPLKKILVAAYNEYEKAGVEGLLPFNLLEDDIIQAMNVCGRHKVNGDSVPKGADEIYDYNIYVGGTMLGRGLTLKGLAITYIIRTAKGVSTVDTVQQRARWFGYKMKYLDLCRIFAVGKIIREFQEIRDHEEDLWETVRAAKCQGTNFKNMARIFALSDDLKMTRSSVARTENYTFKFWNKQREFQDIQEYVESNKAILAAVRIEHERQIVIRQFGEGAPFAIIPGVEFDYVKKQIFDKFCFATNEKFNRSVVDKLAILLKRKGLQPKVDIIWMRDGTFSKHAIDCGHIPNYSVGRRPQSLSKPAIYLGDDYQFISADTMQLQIHEIQDIVTGVDSPTLAFYIPKNVIEKLTNLVIQAE